MKRLVYLLAFCLSFAAHAELMWQRNNGVWEAVVRVSKEEPVWEIGAFSAVTNGYVTIPGTTNHYVESRAHIAWSYWRKNAGSVNNFRPDTSGPYYTCHSYNYTADTIDAFTNGLAERVDFRAIDAVEWYDVPVVEIIPARRTCGELPCRFGVPQTITVDHPYTDLLEMLPLDWPETYTRVKTGFDGYLLIRFDEREMRLTIKRLLPEKLPYEHPRQNIRVLRDDLLYGV